MNSTKQLMIPVRINLRKKENRSNSNFRFKRTNGRCTNNNNSCIDCNLKFEKHDNSNLLIFLFGILSVPSCI